MKLNVIKNRINFFILSGVLIVISISLLLFWNLNLGIDMTWGTQAEYSYEEGINIEKLRVTLSEESKNILFEDKEVINDINAYKVSWEDKLSIVTWFDTSVETEDLEILKNDFRMKVLNILKTEDPSIIENSYTNIWKSFWDYIKNTAILTLVIAIAAIAFYVTWAFSWVASGISVMSFSLITIVTLFHDVIISTGFYLLISSLIPEFKIDTFFITALLTILGYSINDTIVVFDRIRSNLKEMLAKNKSLEEIIEVSVSETLRRSIFTSLTLFFVLLTVFLFGPETIRGFVLAMMFGTIVGTYSSIYIASPLLFEFNKKKKITEYKEAESNIEDKIVV